MSLEDVTESDIESISSTGTLSEGSAVETGYLHADAPTASPDADLKHPRFFFDGNLVTFWVEGTLYRVHEYLLTTNSSFWNEKLSARVDKAAPIKLEDVAPRDLDALLTILYDTKFREYDLKTAEDWESVLRLSTRWQFTNIRTLAISKIDSLATSLQKLVMARAFDVPKWLQPSLVTLCMRPDPLTLAEGKQLSTEDLVSIMSTREAVRQKTQVTPEEKDVCSYIAKHILRTEPIGTPTTATTFATKPLVPASARNTPSASSTTSRPELPIPNTAVVLSAVASPPNASSPAVLTAKPSARDIEPLLAAAAKLDFDSALRMASLEGAKAFIDTLRDFTAILRTHASAESFVIAILRRASRRASFIGIAVRLLSELGSGFYCGKDWLGHTLSLGAYLKDHNELSQKIDQAINRVRSQFGDFGLALRHVTVSLSCGDPQPFLDIVSSGDPARLTAAVYDERNVNFKLLFIQLKQARLL